MTNHTDTMTQLRDLKAKAHRVKSTEKRAEVLGGLESLRKSIGRTSAADTLRVWHLEGDVLSSLVRDTVDSATMVVTPAEAEKAAKEAGLTTLHRSTIGHALRAFAIVDVDRAIAFALEAAEAAEAEKATEAEKAAAPISTSNALHLLLHAEKAAGIQHKSNRGESPRDAGEKAKAADKKAADEKVKAAETLTSARATVAAADQVVVPGITRGMLRSLTSEGWDLLLRAIETERVVREAEAAEAEKAEKAKAKAEKAAEKAAEKKAEKAAEKAEAEAEGDLDAIVARAVAAALAAIQQG